VFHFYEKVSHIISIHFFFFFFDHQMERFVLIETFLLYKEERMK